MANNIQKKARHLEIFFYIQCQKNFNLCIPSFLPSPTPRCTIPATPKEYITNWESRRKKRADLFPPHISLKEASGKI